MGALKDRLRTDLTTAMRERDSRRVATLRLTLSAITTEEVSGDVAHELADDQEQAVLAREVRKRREAAETYASAGRPELAAAETEEASILTAYLPQPLTDEELAAVVAAAVAQVTGQTGAAPGRQQMGQVVRAANTAAAGRAEGGRVAAAVRAALA